MVDCPICGTRDDSNISRQGNIWLFACPSCLNINLVSLDENGVRAHSPGTIPLIGELAPKDSVMDGVLKLVPATIENLPVLPEVPQRVIAAIHDPVADIKDIAAIIEGDPAFSTKILSLANSAYFATISEINDLDTACTRLGMRAIAKIATALAYANQYKSSSPIGAQAMQKLWDHALTTAYLTEAVAEKIGVNSDIAFLGGLLHDIGNVVLVDTLTTRYSGRAGRVKDDLGVMAKAIGPLNPAIGLHVAQHWRLSTDLAIAIYYAHMPAECPKTDLRTLVNCVSIASHAADANGHGLSREDDAADPNDVSLENLGLDQSEFQEILDDTENLISSILPTLRS